MPAQDKSQTARLRGGSLARDIRLILTTAGVTSVAWLAALVLLGPDLALRVQRAEPAAQGPQSPRPADDGMVANGPSPLRATVAAPVGQLRVPVIGVAAADLSDNFRQARDGGTRRHEAIDIMAAAGTPVVAAAAGTVEKIFLSAAGGKTVYMRTGDGSIIHYYAHLADYAPGLAEGQRLASGDPVGFVGASGNADPAAPHLHFAVLRLAEGEQWWQGTPMNPYPLLTRK